VIVVGLCMIGFIHTENQLSLVQFDWYSIPNSADLAYCLLLLSSIHYVRLDEHANRS
jgi:hypothetical protein